MLKGWLHIYRSPLPSQHPVRTRHHTIEIVLVVRVIKTAQGVKRVVMPLEPGYFAHRSIIRVVSSSARNLSAGLEARTERHANEYEHEEDLDCDDHQYEARSEKIRSYDPLTEYLKALGQTSRLTGLTLRPVSTVNERRPETFGLELGLLIRLSTILGVVRRRRPHLLRRSRCRYRRRRSGRYIADPRV